MTSNVPQAVSGRRITYTHPITAQVLPGTIALIEEGNLLRCRLDTHRLTLTVTDTSDKVTYLEETGTLPVPVPAGRFQPIPEEMNAVRGNVPLAVVGANDLILLTTDPDAAVAAATAYLPDMGFNPDTVDWSTLEARWAVFEWPEDPASLAWTHAWAVEGDDQAVPLFYLPEPPAPPVA
ncbi:hypothetical protein [Streptomyces sp. NPDC058295]|uniref:hypothetical protein n=1 Tax=Streptomyces sp. NPDC058295 TaxID=3346431 RepID=UPI0036F05288